MFKPSKKILFFLITSSAILGTISFTLIDWDVFNSGTIGMIREIATSIILYFLGFLFLFQYVKKLKEENNEKK